MFPTAVQEQPKLTNELDNKKNIPLKLPYLVHFIKNKTLTFARVYFYYRI